MDSLFPVLPKKLADLSDGELDALLAEHEEAAGLIQADDEKFLEGYSATEVIEQYRAGAEQIETLRAEVEARETAAATFVSERDDITARITAPKAEEPAEEETPAADEEPVAVETEASAEEPEPEPEPESEPEAEVTDPVAERLAVAASAEGEEPKNLANNAKPEVRMLRKPPAPAKDRIVVNEPEPALAFVASGFNPGVAPGSRFEGAKDIAKAIQSLARSLGPSQHRPDGREERFPVAQLDYSKNFPEDRVLHSSDWEANADKIRKVGTPFLGHEGLEALVASGGLCAPLEPIYSMPNLAVTDRPVRDALPNFRAERGGVNVPTPTTVGDASAAITTITEANDALGGTFATKACLDMSCPSYTETAVTIISHCREFGNLNAMAWPEKIAHENAITMAEHARTAEGYLLDRIKAQSVNVTVGAETLGALIYTADGILKQAWGIRGRLRMPRSARFTLLAPMVLSDLLLLDTVQTQYDRYRSRAEIEAYLAGLGVDVAWYIDTPSTGTTQLPDSAQTAAAIDPFPDNVQMALFPSGTFLHIDMAELNLGLVRDSTLNSTNDFQIFGEVFENVALIGPAQAAMWITADICANGNFPPAGTSRTCD